MSIASAMRILFLQKRGLFPANAGSKIRTLNVLRRLARRHEITCVCNLQPGEEEHAAQMRGPGVRLEAVPWWKTPSGYVMVVVFLSSCLAAGFAVKIGAGDAAGTLRGADPSDSVAAGDIPAETAGTPPSAVGASGRVGCRDNPTVTQRLFITEPGVYENFFVDGRWVDRNLVKINCDDVILRDCEIRNGRHNAVTVYAKNVVIENCKIHHLLAGTFSGQADAHGITGQPDNLVIRNCEIYYVSGDAVQFDPDRGPWDNVLIENCTFWTGPLPEDAAGFFRGQRPGENAVDTKQQESNPRSRMTIKNCLLYGWGNGQISTQAALNLKDHVRVDVAGCVLADNEICFRLRGDTGERGGALVSIRDCAVYRSEFAVRMEDGIENLQVLRLGIGEGIGQKYRSVAGEPRGYVNQGEFTPLPYPEVVRFGVRDSAR